MLLLLLLVLLPMLLSFLTRGQRCNCPITPCTVDRVGLSSKLGDNQHHHGSTNATNLLVLAVEAAMDHG